MANVMSKCRPFFLRAWKRTQLRDDLRVVPHTEKECQRRYCAVEVPEGGLGEPQQNRHCFKPVSVVIDHLMGFPENHNFCIKDRRVYVCCDANGRWTQQKAVTRKEFFDKLRERIWEKYIPLILGALERQGTSPSILAYAKQHMTTHALRMGNEDLERYLLKHKKVLQTAFFNRPSRFPGTNSCR